MKKKILGHSEVFKEDYVDAHFADSIFVAWILDEVEEGDTFMNSSGAKYILNNYDLKELFEKNQKVINYKNESELEKALQEQVKVDNIPAYVEISREGIKKTLLRVRDEMS